MKKKHALQKKRLLKAELTAMLIKIFDGETHFEL